MAMLALAFILGLFFAGAFVGYHFRDLVGKEVSKFAAGLSKAHNEGLRAIAEAHVKEAFATQRIEADAAKVVDAVKASIERQAQKL